MYKDCFHKGGTRPCTDNCPWAMHFYKTRVDVMNDALAHIHRFTSGLPDGVDMKSEIVKAVAKRAKEAILAPIGRCSGGCDKLTQALAGDCFLCPECAAKATEDGICRHGSEDHDIMGCAHPKCRVMENNRVKEIACGWTDDQLREKGMQECHDAGSPPPETRTV